MGVGGGVGVGRGGEGVGAQRRVEAQASTSQPHGPASHKRFPDEESFVRLCAPYLRAFPEVKGVVSKHKNGEFGEIKQQKRFP